MAQIKAQRLKHNAEELFNFRFGLTRSLYYRGLTREQIVEFFNFIGWLIRLPESLEIKFIEAIKSLEEELKMPYINTVEQYGRKQGILEGMEQGLERGREEGIELGAENNLRKNVVHLQSKLSLTANEIAEILEVPLEKIKQILSQVNH